MQPNDDFRNEDGGLGSEARLKEVLQEWQAPPVPESLAQRVLHRKDPWWRFLLAGYIRVPVPVACCVAIVVIFAAWRSVRPPLSGAPCSIAERPSVCTSAIPGMC